MRWPARKPKRTLPDFLVIGAQKCGTTFLYQSLLGHPDVLGASKREVHFFTTAEYAGGRKAYREYFPPAKLARGKVVGEKSPNYLFFPGAARRASKVVPKAKVIVLLRDPVDRAYSHYHHSVRLGRETLSFEEALKREPERTAVPPEDVAFRTFSYVARGVYLDQLKEWHASFGRERVLILKSESMYQNPQETFARVQEFLGVPARALEPGRKNQRKGEREDPMNPQTRRRLEAFFEPHNRRLYEYLGTDFGW